MLQDDQSVSLHASGLLEVADGTVEVAQPIAEARRLAIDVPRVRVEPQCDLDRPLRSLGITA